MTTRPIEVFQPCDLPRRGPRCVLVNDRVPRFDAHCTLCCVRIERGYVRDPHTRLIYCATDCFTEHEKMG
jgi:hypothetical protein